MKLSDISYERVPRLGDDIFMRPSTNGVVHPIVRQLPTMKPEPQHVMVLSPCSLIPDYMTEREFIEQYRAAFGDGKDFDAEEEARELTSKVIGMASGVPV